MRGCTLCWFPGIHRGAVCAIFMHGRSRLTMRTTTVLAARISCMKMLSHVSYVAYAQTHTLLGLAKSRMGGGGGRMGGGYLLSCMTVVVGPKRGGEGLTRATIEVAICLAEHFTIYRVHARGGITWSHQLEHTR